MDALEFRVDFSPAVMLATVWRCPGNGSELTLVTAGFLSSATEFHGASLASARCGTEALRADDRPSPWELRGDLSTWEQTLVPPRSLQLFRATPYTQLLLVPANLERDPELCEGMLRGMRAGLDSRMDLQSEGPYPHSKGGCVHHSEATSHETEEPLQVDLALIYCEGESFAMACITPRGDRELAAACKQLAGCRG